MVAPATLDPSQALRRTNLVGAARCITLLWRLVECVALVGTSYSLPRMSVGEGRATRTKSLLEEECKELRLKSTAASRQHRIFTTLASRWKT